MQFVSDGFSGPLDDACICMLVLGMVNVEGAMADAQKRLNEPRLNYS